MNCTPSRADWLRKQKRRDYWRDPAAWEPRKFARLQWCALPAVYDDWSKHWTGRKGTGPYRNANPCSTPAAVCTYSP